MKKNKFYLSQPIMTINQNKKCQHLVMQASKTGQLFPYVGFFQSQTT